MRILLWETTEFLLYLIKNKKWIHKRTFPSALRDIIILKSSFHRIALLIWNLSDPFRNAFHSNVPPGRSAITLFLCSTLLSISQEVSNGLSFCPPLVRKDYFRALLCHSVFEKLLSKCHHGWGGIVSLSPPQWHIFLFVALSPAFTPIWACSAY